jgi:hypothetical protein
MLGAMSDDDLGRRRHQLMIEISRLGPCLPGTLTERTMSCASPGCHCHADPPIRHGPYRQWTRKVAGKTVTRTLTPEQAARYRPWLDNKRRLDELVALVEQLAVAEMARNELWPDPDAPPADRRRRGPAG